jgi:hypothetical protein
MRHIALALMFLATPALAKGKAKPKEGQFCKAKDEGKTKTDKGGATLTCKKDSAGKYRWDK